MDNDTSDVEPKVLYELAPSDEPVEYYDALRRMLKKAVEEKAEENYNGISERYYGE